MFDIDEIVAMNGGDPTPALDTHNLTGRVYEDEATYTPMGDPFDEWTDYPEDDPALWWDLEDF